MPQTQTSCPRCRQPLLAEVEQIFDVSTDPKAKSRFLSGMVNIVRCPACGFQGQLSLPVVYHDAGKELLLTYFPPELGLQANEQERLIGPLINKVVNGLPPEKRKAYLLRPQTMLTMQRMVETILEADGITREMLEKQQQRVRLLERLAGASSEERKKIIKEEEAQIDEDLFAILSRLFQVAAAQGDEQSARQLAEVQKDLIQNTAIGKELQKQSREVEDVVQSLQKASQNGELTREKLLDMILATKSEAAFNTLVSLARNGLDYAFFEVLTQRIDNSQGEKKAELVKLREKLLEITHEIDQALQKAREATRQLLDSIVKAPNVEEAVLENLGAIDQYFVDLLGQELEAARKAGDLERSVKLQQIMGVIEKASAPPPEIAFIEELLEAEDEDALKAKVKDNGHRVTPEFLQVLNGIIAQSENQKQPAEIVDRLKRIYRISLRASMQQSLSK